MTVDFQSMTTDERLNYISERDGYVNDNNCGVDSDGNEFRDDNGLALFILEYRADEIEQYL